MTILKRFFRWLSRDMDKGSRGERPTTLRPPPPKKQGCVQYPIPVMRE